MEGGFERIAIVNRGEPAMRLIHAVEEVNAGGGGPLRTIALFTDPDEKAQFVRRADEAYRLGPATTLDADGNRHVTYLDLGRLEEALVRTRADAAWVGWGFVAERAEFAELCERLGVTFIGPSSKVMRRLGDKITSKQVAEASDVPVASWSGQPVETIDEARQHAERLGYPLLIKATAGGGGRGIRRVESDEELESSFESARAEARSAFGNGDVFLETLVTGAKHIEVQMIGDSAGTVWSVGVRDCSVQRRNQKLFEEAPSPSLSPEQDAEVRAAAARLGRAAGYRNAGTVEFLFDPETEQFAFMEVNARLQVEHPVTELTTGVDMVKLQLHVAAGGLLEGDPPPTVGHAIEARVNAEDPDAGFAPAPGRIELLALPTGPGIRVDTGVQTGDEVAPEFDSMIAKVLAVGRDREEALARLRRGLADTSIVIAGGSSNKAFLRALLDTPEVVDATADVAWVDRTWASGRTAAPPHADVAIIAAAIDGHREQMAAERASFRASAARGRPEVDTTFGRKVSLRYRGEPYPTEVFRLAPDAYRVELGDISVVVHWTNLGPNSSRLEIRGVPYRVVSSIHGVTHYVEVNGNPHRIGHDEGGIVRAPAPSVVVAIDVAPGDEVKPGDRLAVVEAMKMETVIEAEFAGTVDEIVAVTNSQVSAGAPLLVVLPQDDAAGVAGERVSFDAVAAPGQFAHSECRHYLEAVEQALLGFDVDPRVLSVMANPGSTPCPETLDRAETCAYQDHLLEVFTDVIALFRRDPVTEDPEDLTRRSTEEYLYDYLLRTESRGRDLPDSFVRQLERALRHFGLTDLEASPALDIALHRIVLSQRRLGRQIPVVLEILEDRLEHATADSDPTLRQLLDRVVDETRDRYPAVRDLAVDLRYRVFDEPFLAEVRDRTRADAIADLDALATDPSPAERSERIDRLVECSQPLKTLLSHRFTSASEKERGALLEVMTRRYYRIRRLEDVTVRDCDGLRCVSAEYDHEGLRTHVISTHVGLADLPIATRKLATPLSELDAEHEISLDVYAWRDSADAGGDGLRDEIAGVLSTALGHLAVDRIVVAVSQPGGGIGMSSVLHYTFRPDGAGGYQEDSLYRDLHPMMGTRLELWRLDEFELERVPTSEDVYLFRGHARENRRDERLFAIAEIRDLTPLLDESGRVVRVPEAERMIQEVLGAVRRFQAHRPASRRLEANRIILYVWPDVDLSLDDIGELVRRLIPDAIGLGLDKVEVLARFAGQEDRSEQFQLEATSPTGTDPQVRINRVPVTPIRPLRKHEHDAARLRQRGLISPYELVGILAPGAEPREGVPAGDFVEYDLDEPGQLRPVASEPGENSANIVVGVVENRTERYPDGVRRVVLLGDPRRGMGNLAEAECRRINAAFDLADEMGVPLEWFAVSAGAKIAMDSGTENMDWIAKVLRRIIEFTQGGGEVNIVVTGINVGAQPYWNAEATMLMHTKGILIMIPDSAMVLTGKDALDFSGGVSADDNVGIGGYERIMGPNGQAQYFARDVPDACVHLLQHYEYTYVAPGERWARPAASTDPADRDVRGMPHGGQFETVGEVFDEISNPGRKQPFEIRRVMEAVVDQDHATMERWFGMRDAEIPVVWDAFLGSRPVALIGFEAKSMPRPGFVPADGPTQWTSGTLFPAGSRKVARAINAASGNRPLVVLANLSGFDGSPESMRERQLEYGAEIGRAVVNFDGPIVFCVVSRYHGGAFVVFSGALNDNCEIAAIEGSHASVIGGAPAAAVVFARDVRNRVDNDQRVVELTERVGEAHGPERARLRAELGLLREQVHADKLGEVADEFDAQHDIGRAQRVGSVDAIIAASELRPYLIDAVERGIARDGG